MRPFWGSWTRYALAGGAILAVVGIGPGPDYADARIADAIKRAEGPRHPYGILSVVVSGPVEARAVCLRTIKNSRARWIRAGRPGSFVDWLSRTYCPGSDRARWVKLVKKMLK